MANGRKVLILDDNVLEVIRTGRALEAGGYQVVKMSTPSGAFAKIEYERPDVLLLDPSMHRLRVDDLLKNLRGGTGFNDLVVVAFSTEEAAELHQYCVEHDINGYFSKAMDIDSIAEFLDNFYEDE